MHPPTGALSKENTVEELFTVGLDFKRLRFGDRRSGLGPANRLWPCLCQHSIRHLTWLNHSETSNLKTDMSKSRACARHARELVAFTWVEHLRVSLQSASTVSQHDGGCSCTYVLVYIDIRDDIRAATWLTPCK